MDGTKNDISYKLFLQTSFIQNEIPFRHHIIFLQDVLGCRLLGHIFESFQLILHVLDHLEET